MLLLTRVVIASEINHNVCGGVGFAGMKDAGRGVKPQKRGEALRGGGFVLVECECTFLREWNGIGLQGGVDALTF